METHPLSIHAPFDYPTAVEGQCAFWIHVMFDFFFQTVALSPLQAHSESAPRFLKSDLNASILLYCYV